jgi:glycerol-3-phosphate dehydrogenase
MKLRQRNIEQLQAEPLDTLIIGGGINGAVSAASLTASGARVGLIDARDFAGFTSQHSSNLVWGGIKYMESYEFRLVNDLCKSRNELLRSFPSTVREIRFLTTIQKGFRYHPRFMILGTWLYWLFGRGKTRIPRLLSPAGIKNMEPLINTENSSGGIEYSDAYLHDNDARFVFNFVRSAMHQGCLAANYVKLTDAQRDESGWICSAEDQVSNQCFKIRCKTLVNAAGGFVDALNEQIGIDTEHRHAFSKGIHLIVPRISREKRVLAFFADDGRLFFAIPMANRTCIGTTDTLVDSPITSVSDQDRDFVLSNINRRLDLARPLTRDDIIAERCGIRPLAMNRGQTAGGDYLQLSRKHVIESSQDARHISIFGGKLTDCLNVGQEVRDQVARLGVRLQPLPARWYGEPDEQVRSTYFRQAHQLGIDQVLASDTGEMLSERLWRRYAEHALPMLDLIEHDPAMADTLIEGSGIRRCEIDYLVEHEMIVKLEDYLRRRSKLEQLVSLDQLRQSSGLLKACERLFGEDARARYEEYFASHDVTADSPASAAPEAPQDRSQG